MRPDRFDLEQHIMDCWNVVEDIKLISQVTDRREMSEDELANALLGLETLYQLKFERLFDTFSNLVSERKIGP